ncbi:hypothetical protein D3C86_1579170 [compost metagenome]
MGAEYPEAQAAGFGKPLAKPAADQQRGGCPEAERAEDGKQIARHVEPEGEFRPGEIKSRRQHGRGDKGQRHDRHGVGVERLDVDTVESKRDTEREAEENGFLLDDEDRQVRHGGDEEQDGEGRQGEAAHRRQQDADEQVAQEIKRHIYRQLFERGSMADDFTRAGIPQIGEIPDADIKELDQQYGRKQRAIPQKERQQHGF